MDVMELWRCLVDVMESHSAHHRVASPCCRVFALLSLDSSLHQQMSVVGVIPALVRSLAYMHEHADVSLNAIATLNNIAHKADYKLAIQNHSFLVFVIFQVMATHCSNRVMQLYALVLLTSVCQEDMFAKHDLQPYEVDAIVASMKEFYEDSDVQIRGCILIDQLANTRKHFPVIAANKNCVQAVMEAVINFVKNEELQQAAACALEQLSRIEENKHTIVKLSGVGLLQGMLETYHFNMHLVAFGIKVLTNLATVPAYRNLMLEAALTDLIKTLMQEHTENTYIQERGKACISMLHPPTDHSSTPASPPIFKSKHGNTNTTVTQSPSSASATGAQAVAAALIRGSSPPHPSSTGSGLKSPSNRPRPINTNTNAWSPNSENPTSPTTSGLEEAWDNESFKSCDSPMGAVPRDVVVWDEAGRDLRASGQLSPSTPARTRIALSPDFAPNAGGGLRNLEEDGTVRTLPFSKGQKDKDKDV
eukprot:TRINITY_DN66461_c5_g9_i1.p1 TRINITY_DN66461_c5_g9~~TRINITY_DN66461_c5_g9_i1.p1  ORF type:complete len:553 (+),score=23.48 TRINITY_DN66461_c5_g9_i1:230-1660(+)